MTFTVLAPADLHRHWPWLKAGIEHIVKKTGSEFIDFIPEDVYANLRGGQCVCHIAADEGGFLLGFAITYPQARPFSFRRDLFVWLGWTAPLKYCTGHTRVAARLAIAAYLDSVAVKENCISILCLSNRKGLLRWGFRPELTAWRKYV